MPKPKAGESRDHYLQRCMSYPDMQKYKSPQRYAICNSYWRNKGKKKEMSTEILNPVYSPGMLYPTVPGVTGKSLVCPRCGSSNRSSVTSMLFSDKEIQGVKNALGKWNDWVFHQGVSGFNKGNKKLEGYTLKCGWDGYEWFASTDLILNGIISDQLSQIYTFTHETKKEFGAIVLRTSRGVMLDMIQIGEHLSIELEQTRKLEEDEEILGTVHSHPVTDRFSTWDLASFLSNSFEHISMLIGAESSLTIAVKTPETIKISKEELSELVKKWEDEETPVKDIGDNYKFLVYEGKSDKLQLVCGEESPTSLERLVSGIKGSKII